MVSFALFPYFWWGNKIGVSKTVTHDMFQTILKPEYTAPFAGSVNKPVTNSRLVFLWVGTPDEKDTTYFKSCH